MSPGPLGDKCPHPYDRQMSTQSSVVGVRSRLTRPAAGRMNAGRSEHVTTARHLRRPVAEKAVAKVSGGHEASLDLGERSGRIMNEADIAAVEAVRSGGKSGARPNEDPTEPARLGFAVPASWDWKGSSRSG